MVLSAIMGAILADDPDLAALIALVVPIAVVWWNERRIGRKRASIEAGSGGGGSLRAAFYAVGRLLRMSFVFFASAALIVLIVGNNLQDEAPALASTLFMLIGPFVAVWLVERRILKARTAKASNPRPTKMETAPVSKKSGKSARPPLDIVPPQETATAIDPVKPKPTPMAYADPARSPVLPSKSTSEDVAASSSVSQHVASATQNKRPAVVDRGAEAAARRIERERQLVRDRQAEAARAEEAMRVRAPSEAVRPVQQRSSKPASGKGWIGPEETISVRGRQIGGMVYVGTPPDVSGRGGWRQPCRAYIDPSLPVSSLGGNATPRDRMPYWPSYAEIGPQHRGAYLDWLADGRRDGSVEAGYMFLYFYGLERRFVTERPSQGERETITAEVARLKALFADNHSAQRYLGAFLDMARVKIAPIPDDPLSIERSGWDVPLPLAIGLGARIAQGEPLAADWLLAWFLAHPEKTLRTPATRCPEEFAATFRVLFESRFPDGLKVTKPRRMLSETYEAASSEFSATLEPEIEGKRVLDVSGLRKPVEIAQEIADEAMEALDGYSRLCGKEPEAGVALRGHLMLPEAIRSAFPCPARDTLLDWANGIVAGDGLAPVRDVVERVTGERPDKPTKRHLTDAADLLARLGIGMAPDPRFALRRPKSDEPVVLFELGREVETLEDVSEAYAEALLRIALGAFVAHADGTIAESEREALMAGVRAAELASEDERRRLMANLRWFLSVPPDMTLLRKRLKGAGAAEAGALRAALVAAAHADGEVSPEEVSSLEKAYKALGLDPGLVYSDLHDGPADAPVAVRAARAGASGEAIPPEAAPASAPGGLDLDRIAAIRSDTARVSSVLGAIFEEDATEGEAAAARVDDEFEADPLPIDGLDAAHGRLVFALIDQDHWTEEAFDALARAEGLMPAGALETINEWSFATHDEALLDAYDGYDVEPEIAATLRGSSLTDAPAPVPETV